MSYKDHTFRSYLGFISWVIISDFATTYVIDGIRLRQNLINLVDITTDPKVLKIIPKHINPTYFQRDFGLFLINCLEVTINMNIDKMKDWRVRPLLETDKI